ncbi:hypothetical protein ASG87_06740 [Frateuria sp. Soil773]|uniref:hypothetical protein n=1 Tax=Frateuria sp. Soil773 TaxID=1736407 RepID=UPI0006F6F28E|nr:hypothetical protein [Frateuria sp. Soil773]KRE88308.1 hypothetical protein ASG87_06740 [Frateuria sp. Soil773]
MGERDGDSENGLGLYALVIMGLLLAMALIMMIGRRPARRRVAFSTDIPPSLARSTFSRQTRNDAERTFVTRQHGELGVPNPSAAQVDAGQDVLRDEVFGAREFAVRHVVADRFLRWAVVEALRAPTPDLVVGLQSLFDAFGVGALANQWRTIGPRLTGPGWQGSRWFTSLGRAEVRSLRTNLTNCLGNLFLSESQSNLRAGTRPDITEDALALIGTQQLSGILNALVPTLQHMGLGPRLAFIRGNLTIDYNGASGEYRHYGYDPRRVQDASSNPLALLSWSNAGTVAGNTDLVTLIRTAFQVYPVRTVSLILLLLYVLSSRLGG